MAAKEDHVWAGAKAKLFLFEGLLKEWIEHNNGCERTFCELTHFPAPKDLEARSRRALEWWGRKALRDGVET